MAIEAEATQGKHLKVQGRPLVGGALVFNRVEHFVRKHLDLKRDEVANLAKLTKEFLEAEPENKQELRRVLNATMRTLDRKRKRRT